ncbi:hypothetical protein Tco_1158841, partial [Tanacetum coccineum]
QQFSDQTTEHQFSDNVGDDHLNYEYFSGKGEFETFKREDDSFGLFVDVGKFDL